MRACDTSGLRGFGLLVGCAAVAGCVVGVRPPAPPQRDTPVDLSITTFKLANGLRVVHVRDPRATQVQVTMRYEAGAIDDPAGQEGMAHLVEHIAFEQEVAGASVAQRLAAIATLYNASTTLDATTFVSRAPASKLADLLGIEAERLRAPCAGVSAAELERERDVVLNEIRYRERSTRTSAALRRALLPADHPYNRSVPGTAETVASITRDRACAFAEQHYDVADAVLVVSGPLSREVVDRVLGDLATVPARTTPTNHKMPVVKLAPGEVEVSTPLDRPAVVFVWPLPGDAEEHAKYRALAGAAAELISAEIRGDAAVVEPAGARAGLIALLVRAADDETEANLLNATDRGLRALPMILDRKGIQEVVQLGFSRAQRGALFRWYAQLDDALQRDPMLAEYAAVGGDAGVGAQAPIEGLRRLTRDEAIQISKHFDYDTAKVITLKPADSSPQRVTLRSKTDAIEEERPVNAVEDARVPVVTSVESQVTGVTTRKLANGLTVVLYPSATTPLVDVRIVFNVGTADEPATRRGIATLAAEALYFDERHVKDAIAFATAGGVLGHDVGFDRTIFAVQGLSGELDYLLAGLRRVVREGSYRNAVSNFLQRVRRAHAETDLAADAWRRGLYGDHPYAKAGLLRHADLSLTSGDARAFHDAHYTPANATLVISGRFDPAIVDRWIEFLFADWRGAAPGRESPATSFTPGAFATTEQQDHIDLSIAFNARLRESTRVSRLVGAEMLAEIARTVRSQLAASYDASAELIERRLAATYSIKMEVDATRAPAAAKLLADGVAKLHTDPGFAARTFVAARRRVLANLASSGNSTLQVAERIAADIALGHDLAGLRMLSDEVRKLTIDQMSAALADVDLQRSVIVMRGPSSEMTRTFDALGQRPQQLGPKVRDEWGHGETEEPAAIEYSGGGDIAEPLTRRSTPFNPVYAVGAGVSFATLARDAPALDQRVAYRGPAVTAAFGYRRRGTLRAGLRLDVAWLFGTTPGATPRDVDFGALALGPFAQMRLSGPFWFEAHAAVRFERAGEVAAGGVFGAGLALDLVPTRRGWVGLTLHYGYAVMANTRYGELIFGAALRR